MAGAIAQTASAGVVTPALAEAAVRGALAFTTAATGAGSVYASMLARETLHAMFLSQCRTIAVVVVAGLVIVGGAGAVTYHRVQRPAVAIAADTPATKPPPSTQPATQEPPDRKFMDPDRADKASVVLRVRLVKPADAVDKYGWDEVEVLHVLKNTSGQQFAKTLTVAFANTKSGVPAGLSTIYLEPYNAQAPHNGHWKLLNGGAPDGVSHPAHR